MSSLASATPRSSNRGQRSRQRSKIKSAGEISIGNLSALPTQKDNVNAGHRRFSSVRTVMGIKTKKSLDAPQEFKKSNSFSPLPYLQEVQSETPWFLSSPELVSQTEYLLGKKFVKINDMKGLGELQIQRISRDITHDKQGPGFESRWVWHFFSFRQFTSQGRRTRYGHYGIDRTTIRPKYPVNQGVVKYHMFFTTPCCE